MAEMSDYKWVEGYDCNDLQSEQRPDLVAYQPMFEKLNKTYSRSRRAPSNSSTEIGIQECP